MKTGLLTSSSGFGKYVPGCTTGSLSTYSNKPSTKLSTISLKQNFVHERPFVCCKFDIPGDRLYLLDTKGDLIYLNMNDNSFSTLKDANVQNFTIDGNNSLQVLYVTNKSELCQVSFENRKPIKITNLNMNTIRAFQRNYLRDMILALDYKLLFLCDVNKTGNLKIRSLKASKTQIFTKACFCSNNRFIILCLKVRSPNPEHLNPNPINNEPESPTLNKAAIPSPKPKNLSFLQFQKNSNIVHNLFKNSGQCNIVFFITTTTQDGNGKYQYQLIEIPFLKDIFMLRFTVDGDILFLGGDMVLYGVMGHRLDRAVLVFNQELKIRMMSFDVSLDCNKIAILSNRTVFHLKFQKGLHHEMQKIQEYKQMQYRTNGFEGYKPQSLLENPIPQDQQAQQEEDSPENKNNNLQYEDEDEQDNQPVPSQIHIENLKKSNQIPVYKQQCGFLHSHVAQLKGVTPQIKAEINSVFNNVLRNFKGLVQWQLPAIVMGLVRLIQDYGLTPEKCYQVVDFVVRSVIKETEKFRHYGLVICPEIVAIVERKLGKDFTQFCQQQILSLYSNYFSGKQWNQAINWLLSAGINQKPQNLSILLICILQHIAQFLAQKKTPEFSLFSTQAHQLQIPFSIIYNRVISTYLTDKYKSIFSRKEQRNVGESAIGNGNGKDRYDGSGSGNGSYKGNDGRLEGLLLRQDQIKKALADIRKNRIDV